MSVPKCDSGNLSDIQVLGPLQAYWIRNPRRGPEICVLTGHPGNSDADWLRTLPSEKFLFICSDTRTFDQIVLISLLFLSLPPSYTLSHSLVCTHTYTHLILKTNVHCQENGQKTAGTDTMRYLLCNRENKRKAATFNKLK